MRTSATERRVENADNDGIIARGHFGVARKPTNIGFVGRCVDREPADRSDGEQCP